MADGTSHHEPGVITRFFDRPVTAEIFIALVWAFFLAGITNVKLPTDLLPSNASASVSSRAH